MIGSASSHLRNAAKLPVRRRNELHFSADHASERILRAEHRPVQDEERTATRLIKGSDLGAGDVEVATPPVHRASLLLRPLPAEPPTSTRGMAALDFDPDSPVSPRGGSG